MAKLGSAWREIVEDAIQAIDSQKTPDARPIVKKLKAAWTELVAKVEYRDDSATTTPAEQAPPMASDDTSARQTQPPAGPKRE